MGCDRIAIQKCSNNHVSPTHFNFERNVARCQVRRPINQGDKLIDQGHLSFAHPSPTFLYKYSEIMEHFGGLCGKSKQGKVFPIQEEIVWNGWCLREPWCWRWYFVWIQMEGWIYCRKLRLRPLKKVLNPTNHPCTEEICAKKFSYRQKFQSYFWNSLRCPEVKSWVDKLKKYDQKNIIG